MSHSYDFDISLDDSNDYSPKQRAKPTKNVDTRRRSSVDERTREILERSRKAPQLASIDENNDKSDFSSAYANFLQESTKPIAAKEEKKDFGNKANNKGSRFDMRLSTRSSEEEGFDISESDLEVGAFAAQRFKEKAADRGRRMSFDQETYLNARKPTPLMDSSSGIDQFKMVSFFQCCVLIPSFFVFRIVELLLQLLILLEILLLFLPFDKVKIARQVIIINKKGKFFSFLHFLHICYLFFFSFLSFPCFLAVIILNMIH
jgi:hypothetical protein